MHVNVHAVVLPKALQQFTPIAGRLQCVHQLHLAAGKVVILEVDQEQRILHLNTSLRLSLFPAEIGGDFAPVRGAPFQDLVITQEPRARRLRAGEFCLSLRDQLKQLAIG